MSENEFSAADQPEPQPPVLPETEAVAAIPLLDQLSNDWRRKVALGLLLGIARALLAQVISILFGSQEGSESQNLWVYYLCLLPLDIASIWLISTPLIGQPALFLRLRKLYRFFGISFILLAVGTTPFVVQIFDNPKKAAPLLVGYTLVIFFLGGGAGLFTPWFYQKLAVLAEDKILRRLFGFLKWLAIIFIVLMAVALGFMFSFYTEMVSGLPEQAATSMPAETGQKPMGIWMWIFTLLLCWPLWRLYRRIRVPASRVKAGTEQFGGNVDDGQSFGD